MFCTCSGNAPGYNLTTLGYKMPEHFYVFIFDYQTGIGAETADFPAVKYTLFPGAGGFPFVRLKSCHNIYSS